MNKYTVKYYDCPQCGYVQTQRPFWLDESYKSPINGSDTGILSRNYSNVWLIYFLSLVLFKSKFRKVSHVDYAGGYGILVRLLRDLKMNSYWHDKYCNNLFAESFIWDNEFDRNPVDLLSAFEVFEHFENPVSEIENLLSVSNNILFTTRLIADSPPNISEWWYYGVEHGQHIGFYRKKTLLFLATKYGLNLFTDGVAIHLFTPRRVSPIFYKAACFLSKISMFNVLKRI